MKKIIMIINIVVVIFLSSCKQNELIIITTTSLDNSGLLTYILPSFEEEYNVKVKVIALGTGAALELGRMGEADILLVHDYEREMVFMNSGFGVKRSNIMYNDFIFVGPEFLSTTSLEDTLEEIYNNHNFYSRGDNSGTHSRELKLWDMYSYDVSQFDDWYSETGQSMGSTLNMASLNEYYTLTDRSTFLAMKDKLDLVIVYQNKDELKNQYGIIKVNPDLHNRDDAFADYFYNWIIREDTQDLIASYEKQGEQLFFPNS